MKSRTFNISEKKQGQRFHHLKRLGVMLLLVLFCISFIAPVVPAYASTGNLEIRVGYFGDVHDYRVKASFTYAKMNQLCDNIYYYHNVTNVGTVMGTVAQGVSIKELLEQAGIDPDSVQTVNFRTTDGTQVNNWFVSLSMQKWVNQSRYYYPALRSLYDNSTGSVVPLSGALTGKTAVPSILAIRSYTTKSPTAPLNPSLMTGDESYRFCVGQGELSIGQPVPASEVTSMNSAKWITGMDVTLYGSPSDAASLGVSISNPNVKVGSTTKVAATVSGQDLFEDQLDKNITWTSSDKSIATVDKNGLVTIHKAGKVTITATTANGLSKSVVINGVPSNQSGSGNNGTESPGNGTIDPGTSNPSDVTGSGALMREITLVPIAGEGNGETVTPLPEEERNPNALGAASGFGALCLAMGMAFRITGYRKEV
jgi:uncharacterized protein YjdB